MEKETLQITIVIGNKNEEYEIILSAITWEHSKEQLLKAFEDNQYYYYIKSIK